MRTKRMEIKLDPSGLLVIYDTDAMKAVAVNPRTHKISITMVDTYPNIDVLDRPLSEVVEMTHFELK